MTSVLDHFIEMEDKDSKPFITLRNQTITFSIEAIELIGYPAYVKAYINEDSKQFAIIECKKEDSNSLPFYKQPKGKSRILVRWAAAVKARKLKEMAEIEDVSKGIRFYGTFYKKEKVLIFDITK